MERRRRMVLPALVAVVVLATVLGFVKLWLVGLVEAQGAVTACHYRARRALPDPSCTSGATNSRVRQYVEGIDNPMGPRIDTTATTICRPGWAATVRPPRAYTAKLKRAQMKRYGSVGPSSRYQEDHLIPLELGGAPRDPKNLWPMPISYAKAKDRQEDRLRRLVCGHKLSLFAARGIMAGDWRAASRVLES